MSLQPTEYYSRLPGSKGDVDTCYILDPMIATGRLPVQLPFGPVLMLVKVVRLLLPSIWSVLPLPCFGDRLTNRQILDWGVPIEQIKLLCLLGSMPGIQNVMQQCPGLNIVIAGLGQFVHAQRGLVLMIWARR